MTGVLLGKPRPRASVELLLDFPAYRRRALPATASTSCASVGSARVPLLLDLYFGDGSGQNCSAHQLGAEWGVGGFHCSHPQEGSNKASTLEHRPDSSVCPSRILPVDRLR